jgi:molybdopterin molybdotransferase
MLEIEEALKLVLGEIQLMPTEVVPLAEAHGRILAEDVRSTVDVPPWDNSAMDGYAVRAEDTAEGEVVLRLLETVGAGSVSSVPVGPGTAVAIMTGAPVPPGADAVVMLERTDRSLQGNVRISGKASPGAHIRRRGEDVRNGETVLAAGSRLSPASVGLLASVGQVSALVRRRPVVALLSTGDEVVPPGQALGPGQIWSSNNAALAGVVLEAGGLPLDRGIAPDRLQDTVEALRSAVEEADVVLTTGGVSVGAFDVVKEAYAQLGADISFWKVNMKPGKPLAFGHVSVGDRRVPLFGLPGNPVSCLVNFYQFVRPWLRLALGDPRPYLPVLDALLQEDLDEPPGRARLVRVRLRMEGQQLLASSTGSQSSGVLGSMVRAHGLLLLAPDAPAPRAGQKVRVQLLDAGFLAALAPGYGW